MQNSELPLQMCAFIYTGKKSIQREHFETARMNRINPFTSNETNLISSVLSNNRSSNLFMQKTTLTIVVSIEHVKQHSQPDDLASTHKNKFRLMTIKYCCVCVYVDDPVRKKNQHNSFQKVQLFNLHLFI